MHRRAFTLIELIITGSIMSLLIAITLPTISSAQYAARRAHCGTQVKAEVLSLAMYAQTNGNWLPPGPREVVPDGPFAKDPDRGNPQELFNKNRVDAPGYSSQNGWYGQGLLWQQHFITNPHVYYCVETARTGASFTQCWPQHMEMAPDYAGENSTVMGTYIYRGGYTSAAGSVNGPLKTDRSLATEPLLTDSPFLGKMVHRNGFNVGFLGGYVEFRAFTQSPVTGFAVSPLWTALGPNGPPPATAPATR